MNQIVSYWKQGWKMRLLFGIGGAGLGYLYFITIGCDGGCAITGNPFSSSAYGALVGLLAYPGPSQRGSTPQQNDPDKTKEL